MNCQLLLRFLSPMGSLSNSQNSAQNVAFTQSAIILSLLFNVVVVSGDLNLNFFSDVEEYDDTKFDETSLSSLLVKCNKAKGVCIQDFACPWNRVLNDEDSRCLLIQNDYVCCEVAQVRMPVDMFMAYGM